MNDKLAVAIGCILWFLFLFTTSAVADFRVGQLPEQVELKGCE